MLPQPMMPMPTRSMCGFLPVQICVDETITQSPNVSQGDAVQVPQRQRRGPACPHVVARLVHDELRDVGEDFGVAVCYGVVQRPKERGAGLEGRTGEDHLRRRRTA